MSDEGRRILTIDLAVADAEVSAALFAKKGNTLGDECRKEFGGNVKGIVGLSVWVVLVKVCTPR